MDSRLLRYFLAVYDSDSISAAADRLRISQPAITRSIRQLEAHLGVELFERKPNGMVSNKYADVLARRARLMESEYLNALAEISACRGGSDGIIRIGAGPVWYSHILPNIVCQFLQEWPGVRIRVTGGVLDTLLPAIDAGKLDLVCANLDFPRKTGFKTEAILDIRHVVIAGANHPEAGKSSSTPEVLSKSPWVVLADDEVGSARIWSFFAAHGCKPPRIAAESTAPELLYRMVSCGPYLAHVPELLLDDAHGHEIVKLNIPTPFWDSPAGLLYREDSHQPLALKKFIQKVHSAAAGGL